MDPASGGKGELSECGISGSGLVSPADRSKRDALRNRRRAVRPSIGETQRECCPHLVVVRRHVTMRRGFANARSHTDRREHAIVNPDTSAARRADRLGIDATELHCAHGYLIHEFLSPISNKRTDEFGGTLVDRMRYPLEVYDAVRAVWPRHKPLGVKVSATDWIDAGWDIEQTIEFAKALETRGIDWIDVSSGGISPLQKIALGRAIRFRSPTRSKEQLA